MRNTRWRVKKSIFQTGKWLAYQRVITPRGVVRGTPRLFQTWHGAMFYVNAQIGYPCSTCRHSAHYGRCNFPITEEIRDDVTIGAMPCTGETRVMLIGTCQCSRDAT